jgi:hypothetical protein
MAKAASSSTFETRWWQRDPLTAVFIGWAVIIAGAAAGFGLVQFALRSL